MSTDAGSVSSHSLRDRIELDRYMASKAAASSPRRGLRYSRVSTPGTHE